MKKRRNRNKWIFVTTADMKQFYIAAKASDSDRQAVLKVLTMGAWHVQHVAWREEAVHRSLVQSMSTFDWQCAQPSRHCLASFTNSCASSTTSSSQKMRCSQPAILAVGRCMQRLLHGRRARVACAADR